MSLVKPILNIINSFDSTQPYIVTFVSSGDQVYANEINIFRNSDNVLIYNNKTIVPTFSLQQTIPANTLTNGVTYKIQLRAFNSNGDASIFSDWLLFSCYSVPIVDITNVTNNGIVNGQTYVFASTYFQAQNDPLQSYQYTLYDSNMLQIEISPLLFDGLLQYQFSSGFENNQSYSVKLIVTSQHGMSTSITKNFTANYVQPTFSNLITLTNNPSQASIDVQIEAIRILGQIGSGSPTIENDDWLNVTNGMVYFDSNHGFNINTQDWTLQMWISNITINKEFLTLYGDNGTTLTFSIYNDMVHVFKNNGYLKSHYAGAITGASTLVIDTNTTLQNTRNSQVISALSTYNYTGGNVVNSNTLDMTSNNPTGVTINNYDPNFANDLIINGNSVLQYHYNLIMPDTKLYIYCQSINNRLILKGQLIS